MLRSRLALTFATITAAGVMFPLLGTTTATTAAASTSASPLETGMTELASTYGTGGPDLFGDGTFGWQSAVAQSTVEAYEQATGDRSYFSDIASTYSEYLSGNPRQGDYPDFEDDYTDDTAWWGIAWLEGYLLTGNSQYLQVAKDDAAFDYDKGWNTDGSACGSTGGLRWDTLESDSTGGAIQNELFLELTSWLYNVTGNSTYLAWATSEWNWLSNSGLVGSKDLTPGSNDLIPNGIPESPDPSCAPTGDYWTYNQGVILGALAQYYLATGNSSLLTEAENIATAAISSPALDPGGVLQEVSCNTEGATCPGNPDSFKGIFVQNLKMLATVAGTTQFNTFLQDQAASIEANDISSDAEFGMCWNPPANACPAAQGSNYDNSATQASALDAPIAAYGQSPAALGRVEASAGSGYCMDNTGDSSSDGNPIQIWQCNGDAAQNWEFIPDSNGITGDYMLENSNGKCLDDPADSTTDGTKVQLWTCLGDASQEWTQTAVGSYIEYVNSNGLCLDDTGDSHTDGTRVQVWSCLGDTAQQWHGPN